MSKHGQNHNEQNPLDTMERNDTRTPQEVLESAEAVKARLHEQTLRPVFIVADKLLRPYAPFPVEGDHSQHTDGIFIPDVEYFKDELQEALTTDRDAAYTLLREGIKSKQRDLDAIEKECHQKGVAAGKRKRAISTAFGNNKALDDILTLLDTIYGKTHTV